jgi:hypothetical protein
METLVARHTPRSEMRFFNRTTIIDHFAVPGIHDFFSPDFPRTRIRNLLHRRLCLPLRAPFLRVFAPPQARQCKRFIIANLCIFRLWIFNYMFSATFFGIGLFFSRVRFTFAATFLFLQTIKLNPQSPCPTGPKY